MPEPVDHRLTAVLRSMTSSDGRQAVDELVPMVYAQLRDVARAMLGREKVGGTLQPTALVNEAWLRLAGSGGADWENRRHFFGAAAEAMRRILVEQARRKVRPKHGGDVRIVSLVDVPVEAPSDDVQLVDEVLQRLEAAAPRIRQIVNLRYFGGFTLAETAEVVGVSVSTVERDWRFVRAWLREELGA